MLLTVRTYRRQGLVEPLDLSGLTGRCVAEVSTQQILKPPHVGLVRPGGRRVLRTTPTRRRTTDFEHGMPNHEAWHDGRWEPDPLILDEQGLVVHVRGCGLVVITGCGHAGAVNIARHAMRLTGVDRLHALLGGFHLTGPAFEPIIEPTVATFTDMAPDVLVPAHCTGWKAQHRLAAALPAAFVPNAVGTSFALAG